MELREITPIETLIENEFKKKNVCAYARVSTLKDVAHMSFDTQVQTYTKMITERSDWNFIGVYADEGKSGTNTNRRTKFSQMLEMAKRGHIDLIITKSISRFSRNVIDTISILQDLRNHKVEVWFENENISSFDPKIEFVISVLSGMAEEEARNVSENVKWNVRKQFSEGKFFIVTKGFLGYKRDEAGNLVIDEEEANVVRTIFEMYTSGIGVTQIVQWLNYNHIKTTYNKGPWYLNGVYGILKNEKYTGNAILQKTIRPNFKARLKVTNEVLPKYYVENSHLPIISQAMFDKAQSIRERQVEKYHHTIASVVEKEKYNKSTKYAGLLRCPLCGKNYTHRCGGKTAYSESIMVCASNKLSKHCPNEPISTPNLEKAIESQLKYIIKHKKEVLNLAFVATERHPERLTLLASKEAHEAKMEALQAKLSSIEGNSDEFHQQVSQEIKNELLQLNIDYARERNLLLSKYNPEVVKQTLNSIITQHAKDEKMDQLFIDLIDNITVRCKDQLEFHLKHVEGTGDLKTDELEVNYYIRKTKYRLEHYIVF